MLFVLSREISEILSGSRSECAWFIQIVAFSNIYQSSQVRSNSENHPKDIKWRLIFSIIDNILQLHFPGRLDFATNNIPTDMP